MSKSNLENDRSIRVDALEMLLEGSLPLGELKLMMNRFDFDSEPLVTLRTRHITDKIKRFLNKKIDATYLEEWANLIEMREDISYDENKEREIKQAIHDLSNPV